jgi:hypothetical protein
MIYKVVVDISLSMFVSNKNKKISGPKYNMLKPNAQIQMDKFITI